MPELLTVTEAAARLGRNHSTVSRQIAKLGLARDAEGRFDYDAFVSKRQEHLNPLKARNIGAADPFLNFNGQGGAGGAGGERHSPPADEADEPPQQRETRPGFAHAATAEKAYRARLLKLDIEEREGSLVALAAVERDRFSDGRRLRDRLMALPVQLAGRLAALTDEREIMALLRRELTETLSKAADDIERDAERDDDADAAEAEPEGPRPS